MIFIGLNYRLFTFDGGEVCVSESGLEDGGSVSAYYISIVAWSRGSHSRLGVGSLRLLVVGLAVSVELGRRFVFAIEGSLGGWKLGIEAFIGGPRVRFVPIVFGLLVVHIVFLIGGLYLNQPYFSLDVQIVWVYFGEGFQWCLGQLFFEYLILLLDLQVIKWFE